MDGRHVRLGLRGPIDRLLFFIDEFKGKRSRVSGSCGMHSFFFFLKENFDDGHLVRRRWNIGRRNSRIRFPLTKSSQQISRLSFEIVTPSTDSDRFLHSVRTRRNFAVLVIVAPLWEQSRPSHEETSRGGKEICAGIWLRIGPDEIEKEESPGKFVFSEKHASCFVMFCSVYRACMPQFPERGIFIGDLANRRVCPPPIRAWPLSEADWRRATSRRKFGTISNCELLLLIFVYGDHT